MTLPTRYFRAPRRPVLRFLRAGTACGWIVLAAGGLAHAEETIPQALPGDRYQPIWTRSPFTLSSAGEADAPKGTWALVGLTDDGGTPLVFLLNRQNQERMTVTRTPNDRGFSVESLESDPSFLQSTARIKTPAETLTVRFDPALVAVANPTPQPAAPNAPPFSTPAVPGAPSVVRPSPSPAPRRLLSRTVIPLPLPGGQPAAPPPSP